ncbi:hypothetical protein H5410_045314, partial [Solanum commersonii]
ISSGGDGDKSHHLRINQSSMSRKNKKYHSAYRWPREVSSFSQSLPLLWHTYLPTNTIPQAQSLSSNSISSYTPSPTAISSQLSGLSRLRDFSFELDVMVVVATLDEEEDPLELAVRERVRPDRVMIKPDGLS